MLHLRAMILHEPQGSYPPPFMKAHADISEIALAQQSLAEEKLHLVKEQLKSMHNMRAGRKGKGWSQQENNSAESAGAHI